MTEYHQTRGDDGTERMTGSPPAAPHWLLQLGLVLAAVTVVAWNWDGTHPYALGALEEIGDGSELDLFVSGERSLKRRTPEQKFLLEGDVSRAHRHEQQRAIWEAHPENRVYLGNYITALAASGTNTVSLDFLRRELAGARQLEPDNARFDYLEASRLLGAAAGIRGEKTGEDEAGKAKTSYSLEIRDRSQLDEAMAIPRAGFAKPYWRRYSADMLDEQLAVLGPPRRFIDLVQRTAIAAGTLLPDLAQIRTLSRASRLYAELLIAENRAAEAGPFLEGWENLTRHVTEDSFTLIDVLVAGAIAKDAEQIIPPLYRDLGREADADRSARRAAQIAEPVSDWRAQRGRARNPEAQSASQLPSERLMDERAGVLVSMLLPALGQWPAAEEYEPGRRLEYTVFTEFIVAVILTALLLTLFASFLLGLRWRLSRPATEPPPPILMPDLRTTFRVLLLGVVLPLALFFVVTRYLPASGHEYSVKVATHRLAAEFGLLAVALGTLPVLLTVAHVERRCRALGMATARWQARYFWWTLGSVGAGILIVAWFIPITPSDSAKTLATVGLGFLAASLGAGILLGFAQGLVGQRRYGSFYGSVFRTLVPLLALSIIVLGVLARPALLQAEAKYIERDTLMQDRDRVGFTRLENDLVERLRTEMLERFNDRSASGAIER